VVAWASNNNNCPMICLANLDDATIRSGCRLWWSDDDGTGDDDDDLGTVVSDGAVVLVLVVVVVVVAIVVERSSSMGLGYQYGINNVCVMAKENHASIMAVAMAWWDGGGAVVATTTAAVAAAVVTLAFTVFRGVVFLEEVGW
jgi:hypothetical protein